MVQGQHPHQWAPFQVAGLQHAKQISHTRSPGISFMRVNGREFPLSAILFCQLLPCHLGPPRPTLSINLYVKACWLHHSNIRHVHTRGAFSPSEWDPDPQCQATQVAHWIWWWQCLATWHCRSIWSLPVISLQILGFVNGQVSLAWSIALRTQELYRRPCFLKERWQEERTSSSSLNFFQAVFTRVVVGSSQPPAAESMSLR